MFVLILENHRLLYVREVSGAPSIATFKTTCSTFLRQNHRKFIDVTAEKNRADRKNDNDIPRMTKRSLIEKYPYPELRITPLTDCDNLRDFVSKFRTIDELGIKLLPTNREDIDNDGFWSALGKTRERMGSNQASVHFSNRKDGLDDAEVYEQCDSATKLANSDLKLKGTDEHGDTLKGNNDDFHLSVDVPKLSQRVTDAAQNLVGKFVQLITDRVIIVPNIVQQTKSTVSDLFNRLR